MRNERGEISQILLAILSILLAVGLVCFLYWHRTNEAKRTEQLQKEITAESTEVRAASAEKRKKEAPDAASESVSAESEAESEVTPAESMSTEAPQDTPRAEEGMVISVRGDGFYKFGDYVRDTNIASYLTKALKAKNINVTAENYTMDLAGSLTQMQHAGVAADIINNYVAEHTTAVQQELAAGTRKASANDPDLVIRSEKPEQLARNDQDAFAIIGIGYKGGFMNNVDELIAQQEQILQTYSDPSRFLILGYYPESFTTAEQKAAYDVAMTTRWGTHYLDINEALQGTDVRNQTVRQKIAQMIADKLTAEP